MFRFYTTYDPETTRCFFLQKLAKSSNSYRREDPLKTRLKLYLGQETSAMMADGDGDKLHRDMVHNLKLFREYTTGSNVEKFLVFNLHFCDLNPTVKMYDILMREFIANQVCSLSRFQPKVQNFAIQRASLCNQVTQNLAIFHSRALTTPP